MGYQFLDHMTDAYIEAYGNTTEEAFEFAAKAVVDTMISVDNVNSVKEEQIREYIELLVMFLILKLWFLDLLKSL